ncbi:hypothetical protein OMO38_17195 [Chryseobacterium sp. 09-1422]|uniref:Transcriptional regulator n=1 Tax=Chryseobacterium kimseyorum TaxID=2984028 RepID=A0ABT3I2H9_9FLAO|nr:hypothetical protein [Chryseobacterium kimseyorum]MCW3170267.1 hypothetical protein [Chryseobacterium kimseyorum]
MMKQANKIIDFFGNVIKDQQMTAGHVSLYVSLFQLWKIHEYKNPFRISRREVMKLSRIKSFPTYYKCIKELHHAGFIIYSPKYNSYEGSFIEIIDFEDDFFGKNETVQNQRTVSSDKMCFSFPVFSEVEIYFLEQDLRSDQANQFYSQYQSKNGKVGYDRSVKCWKSAARNWIYTYKNTNQNQKT